MKLELHVHTRYSKDSLLCFWPLYFKCLILKINGIAITEHNNIEGAVKFSEFCKKHGSKVQVIVGEEIFTDSGEIIGLYLKEKIDPDLSPEMTICEIKRQGGIVYIPHPYDQKRQKTVLREYAIQKNKDQIDCIEVHNGRNISEKYDTEQQKIADKYHLTHIVGSDAHTWIEIGRNYIDVSEIPSNAEEFRKIIKNIKIKTSPCITYAHTITKFAKTVKLLKRGKWNELYRNIIRKIKKN